MIQLTQLGAEIRFGTRESFHRLSTERFSHFTAQDVSEAVNDLAARYPDEVATIDRYAVRLMEMV